MQEFKDKIVLVTGGSSGIGFAAAQRFAAEGAKVVIAGTSQDGIDKALAELGPNASGVAADVSDLTALDRLYAFIQEAHGSIDILVANAGICELSTLADTTEDLYDRQFDINTKGTFFTVQKALPLLRNGGAIVLVSSISHFMGVPGYHVYSGTKAAVRAFARNWILELKDRGIRVNCLSPGPTLTPLAHKMNGDALPQVVQYLETQIPLGRLGRPEEQAEAILFLASDRSSFITGVDLCTDGGMAQI